MKNKIMTFVLAGTLTLSALAAPISALADDLSEKIEQQNSKISDLSGQQKEATTSLEAVTKEIVVAEEKAKTLVAQSEATQKEKEKLEAEINDLTAKIDQRTEQLKKQARSVQVNDGDSYIDFIISAESLSDVIGRVDVVSQMVSANRELVKAQADDKKAVESKKAETDSKIEEQRKVSGELEKLKGELETKKIAQESAVATLAASKATAEGERDQFLAEKADAEKKAADLKAQQEAAAKAPKAVPTSTETSKTETANTNNAPAVDPGAGSVSGNTISAAEGAAVVAEAARYLGVPYVWGGKSPAGFDCSGLTGYAFSRVLGKSIGGYTVPQESSGVQVSMGALQAGDLLFWGPRGATHHVAIYAGGGQYIHAPQTGDVVKYQSISGYAPSFAVRVVK